MAAIFLALPGAFCWTVFLLGIFGLIENLSEVFWPSLFLAMASVIISCIAFARFRKRLHWTVILNLAINIPGLLFAIIAFALAM